MNTFRTALALFSILLGAIASEPVLAQRHGGFHGGFHGHARFGVFIGGPVFWPGYYYPPYYYPPYYYPPVASVPAAPSVYIEQGGSQAAPVQSQSYWYYCADTETYYPYVKECPGGWQRVAPQPPPAG